MAQAESGTGFWRSVRGLPGRTPLRVKLMSALLALVAIALVIISVAGIAILKGNLLGPYDTALQTEFGRATNAVSSYLASGNPSAGQQTAVDWIPAGGSVHRAVEPFNNLTFTPGSVNPFSQGTPMPGPVIQSNPAWISSHLNKPFTVPAVSGSGHWRVLMQSVTGPRGTVAVAVDVSNVYTTIGKLTGIDLLVSLAIIVLLGIAGLGLIRASLRPLDDIERTAGAIAGGDLTQRVPEGDPGTEVGRLGRSLNTMLDQIESSFRARAQSEAAARRSEEKMRQFVADASHELRTPLTAIRGFAEYYRQRGGVETNGGAQAPGLGLRASDSGAGTGTGAGAAASDTGTGAGTDAGTAASDAGAAASSEQNGAGSRKGPLAGADMDRIMRRVEQESARMGVLVEDMLLLARMDQQRPLESRPVDLLMLAADAVHDARVVAPGRSINLTVDSSQAPIVIGDEVRLRQVIGNLMTNALNHTPAGTPIDVLIRSGSLGEALSATAMAQPAAPNPSHPAVVLEVADHGPGLAQEQAEHVFERFYRADAARTSGGTGLGLAIVAALTVAHGGAAWVQSRPGEGATFCIALPLSPDAVHGDEDEHSDPDGLADDPYFLPDDRYDVADDPYGRADDPTADDPTADDPTADDRAGRHDPAGQDPEAQPWLGSARQTRGNIV